MGREPTSRLDTFDGASTEPDQGDGVRTVVQLGLEGRDAVDGSEGDRPERPVHGGEAAVGLFGDQGTACFGGVLLELPGFLVLG
jgi:hypothetical protein